MATDNKVHVVHTIRVRGAGRAVAGAFVVYTLTRWTLRSVFENEDVVNTLRKLANKLETDNIKASWQGEDEPPKAPGDDK